MNNKWPIWIGLIVLDKSSAVECAAAAHSKNIFEDDAIIYETWSNGIKHEYNDLSIPAINGTYNLSINSNVYKLNINKDQDGYSGMAYKDSSKAKASVNFKN